MMIDTGDELGMVTDAERKAIQAIKHLGRRWPQTIALLSMNGSLYVVHTDDKRLDGDSTADRGKLSSPRFTESRTMEATGDGQQTSCGGADATEASGEHS